MNIRDSYESFPDPGKLVQMFDVTKKKFQVCVEEVIVRCLVCEYLVSIFDCLSKLDREKTNLSIQVLAKKNLEKTLEEVFPWFLVLKKLQHDPQNKQVLSFAGVCKSFPLLVKILNVLFCVVKFDEIKFSRKLSWKNLNGTN